MVITRSKAPMLCKRETYYEVNKHGANRQDGSDLSMGVTSHTQNKVKK